MPKEKIPPSVSDLLSDFYSLNFLMLNWKTVSPVSCPITVLGISQILSLGKKRLMPLLCTDNTRG
jgi:hypothetical protein